MDYVAEVGIAQLKSATPQLRNLRTTLLVAELRIGNRAPKVAELRVAEAKKVKRNRYRGRRRRRRRWQQLTLHAVTSPPTHARSDEAGIARSRAAGETKGET